MADPGGRPRISGRPSKYFWRYRGPPMPQTTRATIERLRFQAALNAPSWQAPNAIRHHPNTRMRIDRLGRQGLSRRWATHVRRSRPPSWVINVHSGTRTDVRFCEGFRTCQVGLTMSVHRGTADLTVASADFRV